MIHRGWLASIFTILLGVTPSFPQTTTQSPDTSAAILSKLMQDAHEAFNQRSYDVAFQKSSAAAKGYEVRGDIRAMLDAQLLAGQSLGRGGKINEGVALLRSIRSRAEAIRDSVAFARSLLAEALITPTADYTLELFRGLQLADSIFQILGEKRREQTAVDIISALMIIHHRYVDAIPYLKRAMAFHPLETDSLRHAQLLALYANAIDSLDDPAAVDHALTALRIAEVLDDSSTVASSATLVGKKYYNRGEYQKAIPFLEKGSRMSKDDPKLKYGLLAFLAVSYNEVGRHEDALATLREAIAFAGQSLPEKRSLTRAIYASFLTFAGRYDESIDQYRALLKEGQADSVVTEIIRQIDIAIPVARKAGRDSVALELELLALEYDASQSSSRLARLTRVGDELCMRRRNAEAKICFADALPLAEKLSHRWEEKRALEGLGRIAQAENSRQEAIEYLKSAQAIKVTLTTATATITEIKVSDDGTRLAYLDRTEADGVLPGPGARALGFKSIDSTDRKGQYIGPADIIRVGGGRLAAIITPVNRTKGFYEGDAVEAPAIVPENPAPSILFRVMKNGVTFLNRNNKPFVSFPELLANDSPSIVESLYSVMVKELRTIGSLKHIPEQMRKTISESRFKGRVPLDLAPKVTADELRASLTYLLDFPTHILGIERIDNWFYGWMIAGGPAGVEEVISKAQTLHSLEKRREYFSSLGSQFENGDMITHWNVHVEGLIARHQLDAAEKASRLLAEAAPLLRGDTLARTASALSHFLLGKILDARERYPESIREYEQAAEIWRTLDLGNYAGTIGNIGGCYKSMGRFKDALEYKEKSLLAMGEYSRTNQNEVSKKSWLVKYWGYADALYDLSRYAEAESVYVVSLNSLEDESGKDVITNRAGIYDWLGQISSKGGKYKRSIDWYRQSRILRMRLNDARAEALSLANIGSGYWNLGEYKQAQAFYDSALFLRETLGDSSLIAETLLDIGSLQWNLGAYDSAAASYETARAIHHARRDSAEESRVLLKMGSLKRDVGRYAESIQALQQSLELRSRIGNVSLIHEAQNELGETHYEQKNYGEAERMFLEAHKLQDSIGDRSAKARNLEWLSATHFWLRDTERSLDEALQALKVWEDVGDAEGIINALHRVAGGYRFRGRWTDANLHSERALELARRTESRSLEAGSLVSVADVRSVQGKSKDALPMYRRALAIYDSLGDVPSRADAHIMLADRFYRLAEYDSSDHHAGIGLRLARDTKNLSLEAQALQLFGYLVAIRGDVDSTLKMQQDILRIYGEARNDFGTASTMSTIGIIEREKGSFRQALEHQTDALKRYQALKSEQDVVSTYLDIAATYNAARDYPNALKHVNNALGMEGESGLYWARRSGEALLGSINENLVNYDQALKHYAVAESIATAAGERDRVTYYMIARARVHRLRGEYPRANEILGQALAMRRQLGKDLDTYDILEELGIVAYYRKDYAKASAYLSDAILQTERQGLASDLWKEHYYRGLAERDGGDHQKALKDWSEAIDIVERVRGELEGEAAQAMYQSDKNDVYNDMIDLLLKQKDCKDCEARAWEFMDRSKSAELASFYGSARTAKTAAEKNVVSRARTYHSRELAMRRQLELERKKPPAERNQESIDRISAQLRIVQQEFEGYIKSLSAEDRKLIEIAPEEFRQIQSSLAPGEVFLQPVVLKDRVVIFVVRWGDNVPLVRREGDWVPDSVVNRTLTKLRDALSGSQQKFGATRAKRAGLDESQTQAGDPITYCQDLYDWIIKPVLPDILDATSLVISASGRLRYIPFGVLHDGTQYLVERYQLSVLTRAGSISVGKGDAFNMGSAKLLALSNPDPKFSPLPAADVEVDSIMNLFGSRTPPLKHEKATKKNLLASLYDYEILHLATHGYLNDEAPNQSYILLAGDDSKLTFDEIGGLEVGQMKLVTLSACQTALGDRAMGSEIAGLAYGFERAGAKTIVASLWSVNDASTMELMTKFYGNLKSGKTTAAAMQEAQKALLQSATFSHPYFWAPFLVIGSWR